MIPIKVPSLSALRALMLIVTAAFAFSMGEQAQAAAEHDYSTWNPSIHAPVQLHEGWTRIDGELVPPASLAQRLSQPGAQPAKVPSTWLNSLQASPPSTATYVTKLSGLPSGAPLAIYMAEICGAAELYFFAEGAPSAQPLAQLGQPAATDAQFGRKSGPAWVHLSPQGSMPHYLMIHVTERNGQLGGLCGDISLGSEEQMQQALARHILLDGFAATLLLSLAAFTIALFLQRPKDQEYLWLALSAFLLSIAFIGRSGMLATLLGSDESWIYELGFKISYASLALAPALLLMFFRHVLPEFGIYRYLPLNFIPALAGVVAIFYLGINALVTISVALWAYLAIQAIFALTLLGIASEHDNKARFALLATLPLIATAAFDGYRYWAQGLMPTLSPVAIVIYYYLLSHLASYSFTRTLKAAENLLSNLQAEVERHTTAINDKNQRLEEAQQALQEANENLRLLSITDGLTKAYNRMFFEQSLEKEWRRCGREQQPLSVILLDADFFKRLNDTAGHLVGDQCLRELSKVMRAHFKRAGDLVARYGGEEFLVMLPNTPQEEARAAAERLRAAIEVHPIVYEERTYHVTTSIGVATRVPDNSMTPEALVGLADEALYHSKANGRNRVTVHTPEIAEAASAGGGHH